MSTTTEVPAVKKMRRGSCKDSNGGFGDDKDNSAAVAPCFMFQDLPEDLLRHVAVYLAAPDILRMLCVHPRIHKSCGSSAAFWNMLSQVYDEKEEEADDESSSRSRVTATTTTTTTTQSDGPVVTASEGNRQQDNHTSTKNETDALQAKQNFLLRAYKTLLPRVRWIPIANDQTFNNPLIPDSREGHLACTLGTKAHPFYVFTGGFTDDPSVFCLFKQPQQQPATATTTTTPFAAGTWLRLVPTNDNTNINEGPNFVYGASFTRLDERRAIRFGGFQSGGYTGESNQVAVLTVDLDRSSASGSARWQTIPIHGVVAQARAYHSATLLQGRYLLVVGGMTSRASILQEAILDTHTWQWLDLSVSISTFGALSPSGRHGHSLILDARRNRLVLFGGGDGTDLLRSGSDNTEVWELKMGFSSSSSWKTDLVASLPWKWNQLYTNGGDMQNGNNQDDNDEVANTSTETNVVAAAGSTTDSVSNVIPKCPLSLGEGLCLGRCHVAFRVSPDSVLFCFGSGRPTTNAALAYDLRTDTFLGPHMEGLFPRPRFTAAAVFLEQEGYVLVHGGYCSQDGDTTHDMAVLDLAPALQQYQHHHHQRTFDWLPVREGNSILGHEPISCSDVIRLRRAGRGANLGHLIMSLTGVSPEMRQQLTMQYISTLIPGAETQNANLVRILIGAHAAQLPARVHDINAQIANMDDDSNDDEDGDDDDYDEEDDDDDDVEDDDDDDDDDSSTHS